MYTTKKILAIIPARAGSKGLKKKNIKLLNNKPLIQWTIDQCKSSKYIDDIIVSSDDEVVLELAKKANVIVHNRPKNLSSDTSLISDTVSLLLQKNSCDYLLLLQPTSPLRTTEDIDSAIQYIHNNKFQSVVSVCENSKYNISNTLPCNLSMKDFLKCSKINTNRQQQKKAYVINGAIYIARSDYYRQNHSFYGDETYAYVMPEDRSVDIDSEIDFKLAELLMREKKDWVKPNIEHNKLTQWNWMVQHPQNLQLGKHVDIGAFTYINAKHNISLGDNVQIGSHCSIYSVSTIDNKVGTVTVRDSSCIGSHSTIMPGVTIGKNVTVGAHSFVNTDLPDNSIAFGTPAKIKGYKDEV